MYHEHQLNSQTPLGTAGWIVLTLESAEEQEHWTATVTGANGQQTRLAERLSLAYARGVAEDYAQKIGAGGLVNPKAQWRQREASEKQRWALRKLHIAHRAGLTMGEASDLLSVATLRRVVSGEAQRTAA